MADNDSVDASGVYDFDAPSHVDFIELLDAETDDQWFGKFLIFGLIKRLGLVY